MYTVIHEFLDLQDESYHYKEGDTFPRKGKKASAERVEELSGNGNKIGVPLIKKTPTRKSTAREK